MPDTFQIRPMTMEDYDAVYELWSRTPGVGLNSSDERSSLARYLNRNGPMSFVAIHGEALAGALLCGTDGRRGYLNHLAVDEPFRRRGIGQALVNSCLAALAEQGIDRCNLMVFADNQSGIDFWLRRGWFERPQLRIMSIDLEVSHEL